MRRWVAAHVAPGAPLSCAAAAAARRGRPRSGWRGVNNPWMAEGEDEEEYQYINLLVNPERYTGYKVSGAGCGARARAPLLGCR